MLRYLLISLFFFGPSLPYQLSAAGGDSLIARLQPTGSITDKANILPSSQEQRLRGVLDTLEAETGAALVVVTLPSMEGGQIDDFTNRLFEKWGVGEAGKDNGVMLLIAVKERKMRIEVGYGLESVIPDGVAGDIRDDYVLAHFKQGHMATGVESGALALAKRIADHHSVTMAIDQPIRPTTRRRGSDDGDSGWFVFLVFFVIIAIKIYNYTRGYTDDDYRGGRYGRRHRRGGWYIGGSSSGSRFGGGGSFGGFGGGSSGGGGASGGW